MDRSEWVRVPRHYAENLLSAATLLEQQGSIVDAREARALRDMASLFAAPPPPAEQASGESWPDGVLNREKTLEVLTHHNAWRRGANTEQTDPRMLGLALEAAIAFIAPQQPTGEEG